MKNQAKAGMNGTAVNIGTVVMVFHNESGQEMTREIDLTKGITQAVIEAIYEVASKKLGGNLTDERMAKFLGIGLSTWQTWKRKAAMGTPVHRKSTLCKLMVLLNPSENLAPAPAPTAADVAHNNRSLGQKRRYANLRKAKASNILPTSNTIPAYLFDPNWSKGLTAEQRDAMIKTHILGGELAEHERLSKGVMATK